VNGINLSFGLPVFDHLLRYNIKIIKYFLKIFNAIFADVGLLIVCDGILMGVVE
jgi:hypothetical protein